jgi:hypothetical protein
VTSCFVDRISNVYVSNMNETIQVVMVGTWLVSITALCVHRIEVYNVQFKREVGKNMEWGGAPACTCKLPFWLAP